MRIECFRRNAEGLWVQYVYREGQEVYLASVNFRGAIADLYENMDFTQTLDEPGAERSAN
ncbi:hypothetical protein [Leptothermofonsia sp. ETS-13]|uniref:hypothetical protein n=1 Tax=Leptothermofonsia sp. ETS-13 TaxID=3035696 RepID=UPI003B9F7EA7